MVLHCVIFWPPCHVAVVFVVIVVTDAGPLPLEHGSKVSTLTNGSSCWIPWFVRVGLVKLA